MDTVSPYEHDPAASFAELIIPTPDSVRYTYLLETLVLHNKHVLMTGPTGTGKTLVARRLAARQRLRRPRLRRREAGAPLQLGEHRRRSLS